MNISISDRIIYLGAGCGIGLVIGALFAPHSGEETRRNLTSKVDDLTHRVQDKIQSSGIPDAASQTWNKAVERGKKVASIGKQRFNDSIEAGRRQFNESIETDDFVER
jgi:gas vesicle protein